MKLNGLNRRTKREGEKVWVVTLSADEQLRRVHKAVASRAYQIFEGHKSDSRREVEDWRRAESEILKPLFFGQTTVGESVWLGVDVKPFSEGTIQVWVAPRLLTICGQKRLHSSPATPSTNSVPPCEQQLIFCTVNLRVEVDPGAVTAEIKQQSLEILLKKARDLNLPKLASVLAQ